jgi:hypothetical protein
MFARLAAQEGVVQKAFVYRVALLASASTEGVWTTGLPKHPASGLQSSEISRRTFRGSGT